METPNSGIITPDPMGCTVWVETESELAVFAKITDPDKLLLADEIYYQEQPEAKLKSGSKTRCRMECQLDNSLKRMKSLTNYVFTFKVEAEKNRESPLSIKTEANCLVNKDFYDNWKSVADYCQKKIRFVFKADSAKIKVKTENGDQSIDVPDIKFEVDVFLNAENETTDACKIDVEVDKVLNYLSEHHPDIEKAVIIVDFFWLPFGPTDLIYPREATDEQRKYLDGVYKDLINQPIVKKETPE